MVGTDDIPIWDKSWPDCLVAVDVTTHDSEPGYRHYIAGGHWADMSPEAIEMHQLSPCGAQGGCQGRMANRPRGEVRIWEPDCEGRTK